MLGGIEIPLWAIILQILLWSSPVIFVGATFYFGKKLGKYRLPIAITVVVIGFIFIEDFIELVL